MSTASIDDQDLDLTQSPTSQNTFTRSLSFTLTTVCHLFDPHHTISRRCEDTRLPSNHVCTVNRMFVRDRSQVFDSVMVPPLAKLSSEPEVHPSKLAKLKRETDRL